MVRLKSGCYRPAGLRQQSLGNHKVKQQALLGRRTQESLFGAQMPWVVFPEQITYCAHMSSRKAL